MDDRPGGSSESRHTHSVLQELHVKQKRATFGTPELTSPAESFQCRSSNSFEYRSSNANRRSSFSFSALKRQGTRSFLGSRGAQAKPAIKLVDRGTSSTTTCSWLPCGKARNKDLTWDEHTKFDAKRKGLLALAREGSPVDTIFQLTMITHTVLPRLVRHPASWLVATSYAAAAFVTRYDLLRFSNIEPSVNDGASTLVTFMIVFYVGHCYSRYHDKFMDMERIMESIVNACTLARVHFDDPDEVHRLWRYLNLAHCVAYCGLTEGYNLDNFFMPLVDKWALMGYGKDKDEEQEAIAAVDLDEEGLRGVEYYQCWALDIVRREAKATADFNPPAQAALEKSILQVGDAIKRLYAYYYQVLPYIYTHLVSASCTIYLAINAFLKGLYFTPDAEFTFGMVLPACNVLIITLGVFGLLEVGDTIIDPFGGDPEDFAIIHLVEWTAATSHHAAFAPTRRFTERKGTKHQPNKSAFSSQRELQASILLSTLVLRWKRRRRVRLETKRAALNGAAVGADSPARGVPWAGSAVDTRIGSPSSSASASPQPFLRGVSMASPPAPPLRTRSLPLQKRKPKQPKPRRSCDDSPSMPVVSAHPGRVPRTPAGRAPKNGCRTSPDTLDGDVPLSALAELSELAC